MLKKIMLIAILGVVSTGAFAAKSTNAKMVKFKKAMVIATWCGCSVSIPQATWDAQVAAGTTLSYLDGVVTRACGSTSGPNGIA